MTLPVNIGLLPKPNMPDQAKQFLYDLLGQQKMSRDIAKQNMVYVKEKTKLRFDRNAKAPDFQVNDKVLLKSNATQPGLSSKLSHK